MNNYLITFQNLIGALVKTGNNNVIIGGSQALMAHGLKIGRSVEDIDIIIYKPTEKQMDFLQSMADFDLLNDSSHIADFGTYGGRRCMKFKRQNKFIDILVEVDKGIPQGLLYHKFGSDFYPVQSVDNVCRAKASYDANDLKMYTRRKDVIDLMALKNLNFNYELPSTDGSKSMTSID